MRTLSQAELNRALLARQLLLERSTLSIPAALEQLAGIQNQYAPNAYIRLRSCLEDFQRDDLTRALEAGTVVQATLMRGTIHIVAAADYHPLRAGVLEQIRAWAKRLYGGADSDDRARHELVARVQRRLSGRSMTRAEFETLLAEAGAGAQLRHTIHHDAEIVRLPPSGTWHRRRADLYGLADDVVGGHEDVSADDGARHLVRRYLAAFGPASRADVAAFTGIRPSALKPILAGMDLHRFGSESGATLLDLPAAPLPDPATPAPVRFLSTWDATLLVHARRTGILPEVYRPLIFSSKMPPSFPTFLVDGRVAGTWRHDPAGSRIELQPFAPLERPAARALEEEAVRQVELHG